MGDKVKKAGSRGRFRWLKITLGTIVGVWAVFLVVVQIVLSSSFLMKMADKYIPQYIDADVHIGNIKASVLKSFPNLNLSVSDLQVTYPHDKYAQYDTVGIDAMLRKAGRSEEVDTLLSSNDISLSVNYLSALFGRIHIHDVSIDKPHVYAHYYSDADANWNILKQTSDSADEDTTSTGLPAIVVNKVSMTGRPRVVYTDCADTLFASVFMKQLQFHGRLTTANTSHNKLGLKVDSLFVSGRLPVDTVAVMMDHFHIHERGKAMTVDAGAKAFMGTNEYGRIILPMELKGTLRFPKEDVPAVSVSNLKADIAMLSVTGEGEAKYYGDSTYVKAELAVDECSVNEIIQYFGKNFMPSITDLSTNAKVTLTALCDGYYNSVNGTLPELIAEVVIPKASVSYPDIPDGTVELGIEAATDNVGKLNVDIENSCLCFGGVDVDVTGSVTDVLGDDPLVDIEGIGYASLDELSAFIPDSLGYRISGDLDALLTGKIRLSQMTPYNFYKASLDGYVRSANIVLESDPDTLYAVLKAPEIGLTTISNKVDGTLPRGTKVLALTAKIDSLYATYGEDIVVRGEGASLEAQNAAKAQCEEHGEDLHPIVGLFSLGKLQMDGADSLHVTLSESGTTFKYAEIEKGKVSIPQISLKSSNGRLFAREGVNRYGFRNVNFNAMATLSTFEQGRMRDNFLDSLQKVYPGVPRDSLFRKMINARMAGRKVPDFLVEEDFKKSDINITLNESMAKYLKEWNINGGLDISKGIVITPYFPVKNVIEDVRGRISNDAINLDNFTIRPGKSDISANGVLSGLRRALLGHGPMKLDLHLTSDKIDANELLTAYSAGTKYAPEVISNVENRSDMDYDQYLANVTEAHENAAQDDSTYALVVIPANLIANISLQANEVDYSDLQINWLAADMSMKERCVQLTNALATSNMGDIFFEGFYSTKSKEDIKAGFDLNLSDITADKVVKLFPAVDTIMPMLTSFKGMLNCEMAATSDLDTNMNFITPTMSGIMKISGRDVTIEESPAYKKLARMLMFKNKKQGKVADISVNGLIADNTLEIFPFVLKIDRYTLAMSGKQNFDQTFKYHISVLKSPIPFRFGINLFGNFDDWKFRLCKAQYKNTSVPVFTAQVDTLQLNLVSSIHNIFNKGVDIAVQQNKAMQSKIDSNKVAMGYNPDAQLDSLDSGEMHMLDSLQTAYDNPVDSALNARMDSLQVIPTVVDEFGNDVSEEQADQISEETTDRKAARQARREQRRQERAARKGEAVETDSIDAE